MEKKQTAESKLQKLSARQEKLTHALDQFGTEEKAKTQQDPKPECKNRNSTSKSKIGWLDFASHIITGGILGIILNDVFGSPIFIAVCLIIGFISGLLYCYRNAR